MGRLDGRVAIVTGGAKGIGKVYSEGLAAEGATVVVADIEGSVEVARALCERYGEGRAHAFRFDVSVEKDVAGLVTGVICRCGRIDVLVNNAAVFSTLKPTEPWEIDVELWDRVMAVNVRGPFLMVKHVVPHMIKAGYGKIINIASGTAYRGIPHMAHYVTSKGAMLGFTRALSRDLGKHGIRVNTLAPGLILSDTVIENSKEHLAEMRDAILAARSIKRDGHPKDLIGALVFLASAESDFVAGQTISVCGGTTNT
jgi:NAD(P)-dependent dehydrogenase (short-subunit alcohol dehydrogenase family)